MILTEVDPRAAVKGSRDPLGLQPIWTHFGRKVVGNLTTVTTSVRSFTTLLVGLYLVDLPEQWGDQVKAEERVNRFLAFEQLAGYSRAAYEDKNGSANDVRGIRRVRRRLQEGNGRVHVSAAQRDQILSSQRAYGVWGLFSQAATASGWLKKDGDPRLQGGRHLVEEYHLAPLKPFLKSRGGLLLDLMSGEGRTFEPKRKGQHEKLAQALAQVHSSTLPPQERTAYERALVECRCDQQKSEPGEPPPVDPSGGRQWECWEVMKSLNGPRKPVGWKAPFGARELKLLRRGAGQRKYNTLEGYLQQIEVLELALAAMDHAFQFLASSDRRARDKVVKDLGTTWGALSHLDLAALLVLRPEIAESTGADGAKSVLGMATAMHDGDWDAFIGEAVARNLALMNDRGGSAWVTFDKGNVNSHIEVEYASLPAARGLPQLWEHTFFLNALKSVGGFVLGRSP